MGSYLASFEEMCICLVGGSKNAVATVNGTYSCKVLSHVVFSMMIRESLLYVYICNSGCTQENHTKRQQLIYCSYMYQAQKYR